MTGVVVTRDEGPDGRLSRALARHGLRALHWPTIRIAPPEDPRPLAEALADLSGFEWVVFTSRRAVAAVVDRFDGLPDGFRPRTDGGRLQVAAVGEATADALRDARWPVDLVPDTQTGEALLEALVAAGVGPGQRVLFPASAIARDTVPDGLIEAGAVVVQVEAYRTEAAPLDRAVCRAALDAGEIALVTFTSPSTVENLEDGLGRELFERLAGGTRAVVIGPTTGAAAERAGFDVVVAEPHSLEGLAERVAEVVGRDRTRGGTT